MLRYLLRFNRLFQFLTNLSWKRNVFGAPRRLSFGISIWLKFISFSVGFMLMQEYIVQYYISRRFQRFLHSSISEELYKKDFFFFLLVIDFLPIDYDIVGYSNKFWLVECVELESNKKKEAYMYCSN